MSNNNDTKIIGGFFELEKTGKGDNIHSSGTGLSNGRTCVSVILQNMRVYNVFVPFYCCNTLLAPFLENNVKFTFYEVNERLEPVSMPVLKEHELFLYINYFGLKNEFVKKVIERFKECAIIDNTQAYFEQQYETGWSFNSARKFFGVPDGAYLYAPFKLQLHYERNTNFITSHLLLRLQGETEEAYRHFLINEALQNSTGRKMSQFSEDILNALDYDAICTKRKENFQLYHQQLGNSNDFCCLEWDNTDVPFCYPYINTALKLSYFYDQRVYVPVLWKEVIEREETGFQLERNIAAKLFPLPVDHRYNKDDICKVIKIIKSLK